MLSLICHSILGNNIFSLIFHSVLIIYVFYTFYTSTKWKLIYVYLYFLIPVYTFFLLEITAMFGLIYKEQNVL